MSRKKYDIIIEFFEKRYYIILKLNKTKIMQTFETTALLLIFR